MSEERKKAVWPCVVALLIALPVLYVVSIGPACWLWVKLDQPEWLAHWINQTAEPARWVFDNGPGPIARTAKTCYQAYIDWWYHLAGMER